MAELEAIIERRLIDQLCSGESQWTYRPDIRNEEQLWKNFKYILEQNNKAKLNDTPLSESEFAKVKNDLSHASFYDAGKWLVGENGKVYVHVQRGNETLHLVVMNNEHIAGGTSVYEVINQYQAFKTEENDERDRRFDVTLLINGIPMIHIELKNKVTGETATMRHPQYVRGGNVPARLNPKTGKLEQAEAHINITYNYSHYYYEATDGDQRFAHDKVSAYYADGTQGPIKTEYGIRGLYGKTPAESIPMLMEMIEKIKQNYTDEYGEWIETERTKTIYLRNGKEISEREEIDAILHHTYDEKKEIKFMVNEGDMSNYWTATAANAIKPLMDMIVMASDNLTEKDVVWNGD